MAMSKQEKNDAIIGALNHPLRRQILRHLAKAKTNGGLSPKALAKDLDQELSLVSYHVRLLSETGVLKLVNTEPRRGAVEHFYTLAGNHMDRKLSGMLKLIGKD